NCKTLLISLLLLVELVAKTRSITKQLLIFKGGEFMKKVYTKPTVNETKLQDPSNFSAIVGRISC
ncbi:hypothetical protein OCA26_15140, partial [Bacillus cereus]|nr:hypothetical protein [Bacillus cereus]